MRPRSSVAAAVVVAAGASTRMGGRVGKVYERLGRQTVLARALEACERARSVRTVVVVAATADLERARVIARGFAKVGAVVAGGARRQDSVRCGVRAVSGEVPIVVIHDAARPLVEPALIDRVVREACLHGAAIAAGVMVDTVKEVAKDRIRATLDRERLRAAQTPQAFRRDWLLDAYATFGERPLELTDEAQLMEFAGHEVHVVEGSRWNFKITTREDLAVARLLAARRSLAGG